MTQAPGQAESGNGRRSFLDKAEQVAKIFATGAIPIIIGVGGWIIQTTIERDKEQAAKIQQEQQRAIDKDKISLEYVKIAKEILTSTEKDVPQELTKWSWQLMDGVSPVKFDKDDLDRLIARRERIPTPTVSSNFLSLTPEYDQMFNNMKLIGGDQKIDAIVDKIVEDKARYADVERRTTVPWFVVGIIHYVETGLDFQVHLHNKDPLTARTVHAPAGRPRTGQPPFAWEDSATDAFELTGKTKIPDWSLARVLYEIERYNGFGYRRRQINV
jgi:lysozyme family protein